MKKNMNILFIISIIFCINSNAQLVEIIQKDELARKLENKEKCYIFIGMPHCPWCTSTKENLEKFINKNKNITIYYANGIATACDTLLKTMCKKNNAYLSNAVRSAYPEYIKNNIFYVPGFPIMLKIEEKKLTALNVGGMSSTKIEKFFT